VTDMPQRRADDGAPGLAEVVRRLEEVVAELREMRRTMETTYMRQDVYKAQRQADQQTVKELRGDLDVIAEQQQWNRRIAVSGLLLPILVVVLGTVILAAVGLR
jgi:MFS-type transporter involved in bile tolerance (Atg22 family)